MKRLFIPLYLAALALSAVIAAAGHWLVAIVALSLVGCALSRPRARTCLVTLSVPELMDDIMQAFKLETPEVFGPAGFSQDFKSNTAALGDTITAKISHVPTTSAYDRANGGFKNGVQDVTTLMEDVPVTLNQLRCVTVRLPWITGLASKVDLYKAAIANIGFALGKYVVDTVLATAATNVSNSVPLNPNLVNLDTIDGPLREQANYQKMNSDTRWLFLNTPLASALGADDRVRSELFHGQRNGAGGYRRWTNIGGFAWIREYPDIQGAGNGVRGLMGDHRLAVVSVRKIEDMSETARELRIPRVMDFHPIRDEQSGLELTGVTWQEGGTGDVFLSAAILFGADAGNFGGPAGAITDNAGCRIVAQI